MITAAAPGQQEGGGGATARTGNEINERSDGMQEVAASGHENTRGSQESFDERGDTYREDCAERR